MKKVLLLAVSLWSCTPSPKVIEYGADTCHFCKMTIVDAHYAAQAVTSKGKAFLFDAIECQVQFINQNPTTQYAHLLVNTPEHPGNLVNATEARFLISPKMPSPMGANLTAFESHTLAQQTQKEKGGELLDWEALIAKFKTEGSKYYSQ